MTTQRYFGQIYATHPDGRVCRIRVSYNHSTRASFDTQLIDASGNAAQYYGHPKRHGVTAKEGWAVDPEMRGPW